MIVDTHCHLTDEILFPDAENIIGNMHEDGLSALVCVGYDLPSSVGSFDLALAHKDVYAAVGMHPHDSRLATKEMYDKFAEMATNEKVVAVGEIGLDYHYDLSPRDVQKKVFAEQIDLADSLTLPVILHIREAYEDARQILADNKNKLKNGVLLHCYSGSAEMVKVFNKFDAFYSFGGAITFKNAVHNLEALAAVPREKLVFETDAPYMTPVPFRGKPNQPKLINLVVDKAAEVLSVDRNILVEESTQNAKTLFNRLKLY